MRYVEKRQITIEGAVPFNHALLFLGSWLRNKINLGNSAKGVLEGKIGNIIIIIIIFIYFFFFWGGGGMAPDPLKVTTIVYTPPPRFRNSWIRPC